MSDHSTIGGTRAGTMGGTMLVILSSLHLTDIIESATLAAIGAVVSFSVSMGLKIMMKNLRSNRDKK